MSRRNRTDTLNWFIRGICKSIHIIFYTYIVCVYRLAFVDRNRTNYTYVIGLSIGWTHIEFNTMNFILILSTVIASAAPDEKNSGHWMQFSFVWWMPTNDRQCWSQHNVDLFMGARLSVHPTSVRMHSATENFIENNNDCHYIGIGIVLHFSNRKLKRGGGGGANGRYWSLVHVSSWLHPMRTDICEIRCSSVCINV